MSTLTLRRTKAPPKKSGRKPAGPPNGRPRLAWAPAAAVLTLQAGLLGTLALANAWHPPRVRVLEAAWAWSQHASFYPLLLLLTAGPLCTWLACRLDPRKRLPLAAAWAAFTLSLVFAFGPEAQSMLQTLWNNLPLPAPTG
ncbi:MAG: hypothetical protein AAF593_02860 [Planctomycetota bacterium]